MSSSNTGTHIVNATLAICALVVTGTVVHRELSSPRPIGSAIRQNKQVVNWQEIASSGQRVGSPTAAVTIVEFADFECPACGMFERRSLRAALTKYPQDVAYVFRHWPLAYHRFAYPAARAAECAGEQGRFHEYRMHAYDSQDSLGLKSFRQIAEESGVTDLVAFDRCNANPAPVTAIADDIAAALSLGGGGTPTILVNGLMLGGVPDSAELDDLIRDALKQARVAR